MNSTKMQRQQTVLTEDGELKEVDVPAPRVETVYCIHCGTANKSIASFCRNCGQTFEEELESQVGSGKKIKRFAALENAPIRQVSNTPVSFKLLKIIIVGTAVTIIATSSNSSFWGYMLAGLFIIGWMLTELADAGVLTSSHHKD